MRITVLFWITISWICCQTIEGKAGKFSYKNWRMYNVDMSERSLKALENFQTNSKTLNLQKLKKSTAGLAIIAPEEFEEFETFLKKNRIWYIIVPRNVQREIDIEKRMMRKRKRIPVKFIDFQNYNTLEQIYKWLIYIQKRYSDRATLINAGKSYEKRDILGLKLSRDPANPGIFVEAGIHAREWISPAFAVFLINELLFSNDYKVKDLANKYNWYIFPVTNPDGYVYSHEIDRFWRKTRQPYGKCYGADPNRNWDWCWNKGDDNPCSNTYSGSKAFSEPEIANLAKYIVSIRDNLSMYISIHSYGQMILYPFGQSFKKAKNKEHLKDIGDKGAEAFSSKFGTYYKVGDIYNTVYPETGDSIDWAMGKLNISLSFSLELRPSDSLGGAFDLPIDQIGPTVLETLNGVVEMVQRAEELGYFSKN